MRKGVSVLVSMTGFASKNAILHLPDIGKAALFIEIKTINSRFFETQCRLPSSLNALEVKIINLLQKKLLRGRVFLTVRFGEENESFEEVVPSLKNVKAYLEAAATLKKKYKIVGELTIADLFQLPNIFVSMQSSMTVKAEKALLEMVEDVAQMVVKTRQEEGKKLQKDLQDIFLTCSKKIEEIRKFSDKLLESIKKEIERNILLVEQQNEPAKLKLEDLYATLNKADIHEEITRFKSHLASVATVLKNKEFDKGKRLDFILQELLRETNTIMAKCSHFDISSTGVDIKVELEKAREQVQNII